MRIMLILLMLSSSLFAGKTPANTVARNKAFHGLSSYEFMMCSWIYEGFADYQVECLVEESKD